MTSPSLGSPPVTTNVCLVFVLARELPLSPAEHDVVVDVRARGQRRRWRRLQDLDIAGLDGFGRYRVVARMRLLSPDLDLADLPRVAELLDELDAAVPAAELSARDPLALFGRRGGHVSWDGHHLLPSLPAGWQEPACCRLRGTDQAPSPRVVVPPPATEAELADMLELVDLDGASPSALTAGAAGALRHLPALRAALFGGTRPGGACRVFAALAERGMADRDALIQGARAVLADGDARERASAQTLLSSLGALDARPEQAIRTDWGIVGALGRRVMDAVIPGPGGSDELSAGILPVPADDDWEDDLELEDLAEDEPAAHTLDARVAALSADPDLVAARLLTTLPAFAARAAGQLCADDASAAGACLLIHLGAWPAQRIAGWFHTLQVLASEGRSSVVQALAAWALASGGGPDATDLLVQLSQGEDGPLAAQAVRALAWLPGAKARGAVRVAATRADLRVAALMALADARDVAGYDLASQALSDQDPATRQAAAAALDRVGGARAVGLLEDRLTQDDSAAVRQAAARALARVAPPQRVRALLRHPNTELVCQALIALGEAGRAELAGQVSAAGSHPEAAVRLAATKALGMLAIPATTPRLLQLLLDEDARVGLAALDALKTAGDSRAVRLLRLLAAHPGPPGQCATDVLVAGLRLRQPAPDSKVRILARSDHLLASGTRARIASAFAGIALDVAVGERGLAADGELAPNDLDALADLVRAVATVDAREPGLSWSIRDGQGLIRRREGDWCLDARHGELVRDAGWFRGELAHVSRVPLTAELTLLPPDPAADGALPVGLGDDELADLSEDTGDDATEQTISGFLEEITGASASQDRRDRQDRDESQAQPDPDAVPPRH